MNEWYPALEGSWSDDGPDYADLIKHAKSEPAKIGLAAKWILKKFEDYYFESRHIPEVAKEAFEKQDPGTSVALSRRRLSIYGLSIDTLSSSLKKTFPVIAENERFWRQVEKHYLPMIEGRYEADLAFAYIHSVRRKIYQGEWRPVEYSFSDADEPARNIFTDIHRDYPGGARLTAETISEIIELPNFLTPFRDMPGDSALVAERVNEALGLNGQDPDAIRIIQVIKAGFYRNRGAYLVGRIVMKDGSVVPLIIALLNSDDGIYVDAVLNTENDTHNIFSSTLANFHVTNTRYHELSMFLYSVMPTRPLSLHYSTIGFNHVGKVAVMNEIKDELVRNGEVFKTAIGSKGTVAIGFNAPSSTYALKVIRNHPTRKCLSTDNGVGLITFKKFSKLFMTCLVEKIFDRF